MQTQSLLFVSLFSRLSNQLAGYTHEMRLKERYDIILARQSDDLSFCYGETSICAEGNNLYNKCSAFEGQADSTQWYQCLCGNGYMQAVKECHWCDEVYDITDVDLSDLNTSACSEYNGGTIAPIPASIIAAISAFNATYTGVISGAAEATEGSGAVTTTASGGVGSVASGSSATPISVSSTDKNTGTSASSARSATVVQTLDGGSGSLTAAPTSNQGGVETSPPTTTLNSGDGSKAAQGRNTGSAVVCSVVALVCSTLCLL